MNVRFSIGILCAVVIVMLFPGCPFFRNNGDDEPESGYRQSMRTFVQDLSAYAKGQKAGFIIVPQNGLDLLTADGDPTGPVATPYVAALDGVGQEHPFFGQDGYDQPTDAESRDFYVAFLDLAEAQGLQALVTDYCSTASRVDNSYAWSAAHGFISFAAYGSDYGLDNLPPYPAAPYAENPADIAALADATNFLYIIDPSAFASRQAFLAALASTNHDLLIIDAFDSDGNPLTAQEIAALKHKSNGGDRLVLAYMNIGAAENWRYYWQSGWKEGDPEWVAGSYEGWPGENWVRYWDTAWRGLMFGSASAYLDRIMAAGFDGVYLDNILAYEYFESR